jgi:hypothetical protein
MAREVVLMSPNCPRVLLPQQYTVPSVRRAQVKSPPALRETTSASDATAPGVERVALEPSPSCSETLLPQHETVPPDNSAQV